MFKKKELEAKEVLFTDAEYLDVHLVTSFILVGGGILHSNHKHCMLDISISNSFLGSYSSWPPYPGEKNEVKTSEPLTFSSLLITVPSCLQEPRRPPSATHSSSPGERWVTQGPDPWGSIKKCTLPGSQVHLSSDCDRSSVGGEVILAIQSTSYPRCEK